MNQPTPKVVGATGGSVVGGAISILALYLLGTYAGFNPPGEVAGAISLLISAATTYIGGWLSPHEPAAIQGNPQIPAQKGTP